MNKLKISIWNVEGLAQVGCKDVFRNNDINIMKHGTVILLYLQFIVLESKQIKKNCSRLISSLRDKCLFGGDYMGNA